jgi:CelD/BcsL family acetyltransferase involved in cellulose biosynthesis
MIKKEGVTGRNRRGAMHTVRTIRSTEGFTALEKTWNDLLSRSPSDNYFMTWEWLWNWWQVYAAPGDKLTILLIEEGDETIGIAPFYVRKRLLGGIYPVRRMMFLGTQESGDGDVCSDYLDIIYRDGEEGKIAGLLFKAIAEKDVCDEIYLSKMDTASKTVALIRGEAGKLKSLTTIAGEFVSPYIKLPSTWDEYLNGLTPSMRHKIKKERKKAQQRGEVAVSKAQNAGDLARSFKELTRLHTLRWGARGIEGAFGHRRFSRFHREIMPTMLKNGHLDLAVLSDGGEMRAVLYNIVYGNKVYFYQSGVDTADRKAAFGYVAHSYCIEDAIAKGMKEYDFLPKGRTDDYKDRFCNATRNVADIYVARHWLVKFLAKAKETARFLYRRMKPRFEERKPPKIVFQVPREDP